MRAIFYDTETTGLNPKFDRIIEIAAFDPERNSTFVKFVNPSCPIPREASAIHNITDAMVADAPPFSIVGKEFAEFCDGDVVLIAHNNDAFDLQFLRHEFARNDLTMPAWTFLDSLKWARRYRPDLPRHTLQYLREIYGLQANNAHRALDDVVILHQIFRLMIDDLPLSTVVELLSKKTTLRTMPFGKHQGIPLKQLPKDYLAWLSSSGALEKEENQELRASLLQLGKL